MKISQRTFKKIGVYFILGFFLLSTFLMSAMYFVDMNTKTAEVAAQNSWAIDTSVTTQTGTIGTGN